MRIAERECELGHRYRTGDGVEKDIKKAMYHYRIADECGDLIAHWYLSLLQEKRDNRRLKFIIMPVIFVIIAGLACLSFFLGWDETFISIVACLLCCLVAIIFVKH